MLWFETSYPPGRLFASPQLPARQQPPRLQTLPKTGAERRAVGAVIGDARVFYSVIHSPACAANAPSRRTTPRHLGGQERRAPLNAAPLVLRARANARVCVNGGVLASALFAVQTTEGDELESSLHFLEPRPTRNSTRMPGGMNGAQARWDWSFMHPTSPLPWSLSLPAKNTLREEVEAL